ncbi:hypothetical protein [Amycolatopsis alkalitolerans]|uniref:Uncharacterized protein n=1 Tax=Amycolatopsis alkalitolerans TaxID=2547244 RepID=A0A5C4LXE9_9PSEU|nr:hypothetical protein [Amycolatopsis alkalitolerans]TNC23501.1 hypothetical protein FG385_20935 [Amycolatopsis alkalitolerans]
MERHADRREERPVSDRNGPIIRRSPVIGSPGMDLPLIHPIKGAGARVLLKLQHHHARNPISLLCVTGHRAATGPAREILTDRSGGEDAWGPAGAPRFLFCRQPVARLGDNRRKNGQSASLSGAKGVPLVEAVVEG